MKYLHLLLLLSLAACAGAMPARDAQVPDFAKLPYAPFSRSAAIAVAEREWRLFGSPIDDSAPAEKPAAAEKLERAQGLWQRVGEYWWTGMPNGTPEQKWTGEHDATGRIFPAARDGDYAWSAAFISYVMRIAGAGTSFPYAASHSDYINLAAIGDRRYVLQAEDPALYPVETGDLICLGRASGRGMRYSDLPAGSFPSHCDLVVAVNPGNITSPSAGEESENEGLDAASVAGPSLTVIGGNVDDAVTMKHVPLTPAGMLVMPDGTPVDTRYDWFVVIRIGYRSP